MITQAYDLAASDEARAQLRALDEERQAWLGWKPFRDIAERLPQLPRREPIPVTVENGVVNIGESLPEDDPHRMAVASAARAILPWKKGPFNLYGTHIDAEWRSDFKWDRLADALPDQRDKVVLDVGCNNGYYLFRLLPQEPRFLLGIDPVPRLDYQFRLLQHCAQVEHLAFHMWGWEETAHFQGAFDTIFCMGIVYHHFNPIQILKNLYASLKPGGLLVLESIVVPGEETTCLFPQDRYACMRNVWFVPTVSAMRHFLVRTKFKDIETVAVNVHKPEEQRTTEWNPGHSYENFVDPNDETLTIEGHPAPHRAILFARK